MKILNGKIINRAELKELSRIRGKYLAVGFFGLALTVVATILHSIEYKSLAVLLSLVGMALSGGGLYVYATHNGLKKPPNSKHRTDEQKEKLARRAVRHGKSGEGLSGDGDA